MFEPFTEVKAENRRYLDPEFCRDVGGHRMIQARKFYCYCCIDVASDASGWGDEKMVRNHIEREHGFVGDALINGIEFGYGIQLADRLRQWHRDNAILIERFVNWLGSIVGPDDILTDAGAPS